jgi:hypothetical protein
MEEFDRPRCVRIISDTISALDETIADHSKTTQACSAEEYLEDHMELQADKRAMVKLKEHLEMDCE